MLDRAVQKHRIQHKEKITLDHLFKSAKSSPHKPSIHSILDKLVASMSEQYPNLSAQQFKRFTSEYLLSDEAFWSALYDKYRT